MQDNLPQMYACILVDYQTVFLHGPIHDCQIDYEN